MSWDQAPPGTTAAAHGFIRHAADSTTYNTPNDMPGMSPSRVGRFATVPEGKKNGASKGFDLGAAGPVRVLDFYNPQDVVVFDPSRVDDDTTVAAISTTEDSLQAYHQLGTPEYAYERAPMADQPRTNDLLPPGTYIVGQQPRPAAGPAPMVGPAMMPSAPQPVQYAPQPQFQPPPAAQPAPPPQAQPIPVHYGPPPQAQPIPPHYGPPPQAQPLPYYAPPPQNGGFYQHAPQYAPQPAYPPPPDPAVAALQAELANLRQHLMQPPQQVPAQPRPQATPGRRPPVKPGSGLRTLPADMPTPPPGRQADDEEEGEEEGEVVAEEEAPPTKTVPVRAQTKAAKAKPRAEETVIKTGFETLELPFVNGPLPMKAKHKVFFEIPGAGVSSAWFHGYVVNDDLIALIYDLRYTDGQQYAPPPVEKPIVVRIGSGEDAPEFVVMSMGLNYTIGVFDHIVLVRQPPQQ